MPWYEALFVVLVRISIVVLGICLVATWLLSCAPGEADPAPGDNTACHFDGYTELAVRGSLRTSFDYEGGQCICDCDGIPVDLVCQVDP